MKKSRKILIIAVICLVLVLIPLYMNHPSRKYKRAVELFNGQSYEEAMALFEKIPSYKDSGMYISYLTYFKQYEAGEYEDAESGFASLGDFLDSKKIADDCAEKQQVKNYEKAKALFDAQNYKEAGAVFAQLGKYEEAASYAAYCDGMNAFEDGEYRKAQDLFLSVSGFLDADQWVEASIMMEKDTIYRAALEKYEGGEYQASLEQFQQISGYEDATSYIHYIEGLIALDEEKYIAAATAFRSVSGFKDADELTKLSVERQLSMQYQEAVKLFKDGDYKAATTAFSAITDYADSESYMTYMNAMTDLSAERYKEAIEKLRSLGSFLDSKKQADEAEEQYHSILYNVATAHFEDENYADALEVFSELGQYRDAALYAAYSAGLIAEAEEDYHSAETHFASIPDFKDAGERAAKNHEAYLVQQYALGTESIEAGDYEKARTAFANVKGYLQADEFLTYLDGQAALEAEDYLSAETLFGSLGDFRDSKVLAELSTEKLKPIRYANGKQLIEDGQYEEAAEMFEMLPGYEEADSYADYARILQTAYVGDYQDAIEMLKEMNGFLDSDLLSIYFEGRQAEIDLEYEKAMEVYEQIMDFKDSAERSARLPDMILDRDFDRLADKLTGRDWWNQALSGEVAVMLTKEYQLSNTTMPARFMALADTMLEEGDFEHSYALTALVSGQVPDAADRLDEIQYLYALTEMEDGHADQAEWMLTELAEKDYPEAKETLNSCWQMLESAAREQGDDELADLFLQKMKPATDADADKMDVQVVEIDPAVYEIPGVDQVLDAYGDLTDRVREVMKDSANVENADIDPLTAAALAMTAVVADTMNKDDGLVPDDTHVLPTDETAEKVENAETTLGDNTPNVENKGQKIVKIDPVVDETAETAQEGETDGTAVQEDGEAAADDLLASDAGDDESAEITLPPRDAAARIEIQDAPAGEVAAEARTVTDESIEQPELVVPETVADDLAEVLEKGAAAADAGEPTDEVSVPANENPDEHTDVLGAEALEAMQQAETGTNGEADVETPETTPSEATPSEPVQVLETNETTASESQAPDKAGASVSGAQAESGK